MSRIAFNLLLVALALVALLFCALNSSPVAIELAIARPVASLGIVVVIAFALGLLIGIAIRGAWMAELLAERGRLRRALKVAEAQARAHAAAGENAV